MFSKSAKKLSTWRQDAPLGCFLAPLGRKIPPTWRQVGLSWRLLGSSWRLLGRSWRAFRRQLATKLPTRRPRTPSRPQQTSILTISGPNLFFWQLSQSKRRQKKHHDFDVGFSGTSAIQHTTRTNKLTNYFFLALLARNRPQEKHIFPNFQKPIQQSTFNEYESPLPNFGVQRRIAKRPQ